MRSVEDGVAFSSICSLYVQTGSVDHTLCEINTNLSISLTLVLSSPSVCRVIKVRQIDCTLIFVFHLFCQLFLLHKIECFLSL